jgi:hypothetical protein
MDKKDFKKLNKDIIDLSISYLANKTHSWSTPDQVVMERISENFNYLKSIDSKWGKKYIEEELSKARTFDVIMKDYKERVINLIVKDLNKQDKEVK